MECNETLILSESVLFKKNSQYLLDRIKKTCCIHSASTPTNANEIGNFRVNTIKTRNNCLGKLMETDSFIQSQFNAENKKQ